MAKREYVHVNCFDGVWRISKRQWRKYLKSFIAGNEPNLNEYGKMVLEINHDVTDLNTEQATVYLVDDFE